MHFSVAKLPIRKQSSTKVAQRSQNQIGMHVQFKCCPLVSKESADFFNDRTTTSISKAKESKNVSQTIDKGLDGKSQHKGSGSIADQERAYDGVGQKDGLQKDILQQKDGPIDQLNRETGNVLNLTNPENKIDENSKDLVRFNQPSINLQTPNAQSSAQTGIEEDRLGPAITELLAQKQSSRPSSASENTIRDRKKRTLGRAHSGPLTTSSETLSKSYSFGTNNDKAISQELDILDAAPPRMETVIPSQSLTYEDPDMQKQRDEMIRRLGGKIQEVRSNTVQPVGSVKDLVFEADGIGRRVRNRTKMNRTRDEG